MLDHVCIFSKSGVVLWSKSLAKLKGSPVDEVIGNVLLEEKGGSASVTTDWYTVRWTLANDLDLVIVVVYQKILQLTYVEQLLDKVKREFVRRHGAQILKPSGPVAFDNCFSQLLREAEGKAPAKPASTTRQQGAQGRSEGHPEAVADSPPPEDDSAEEEGPSGEGTDGGGGEGELRQDEIAAARARLAAKAGGSRRGSTKSRRGSTASVSSKDAGADAGDDAGKKAKRDTVWHDGDAKLSKKQMQNLDRSKKVDGDVDDDDNALLREMKNTYLPGEGETAQWEEDDDDDDDGPDGADDSATGAAETAGGWFGSTRLGSVWLGLTGRKVLGEQDLEPVVEQMRQQLMAKNVAAEIADDICASVRARLRGQKLASFTRVKTAVRQALKEAVTRVLTPNKSTDLLREVLAAREAGRPYSAVFVGINGVGKSTSLAKVAYYLKQNGVKVLIAACDTFRSGAVEQLNVHAKCLDVPLFEKGYARDPAMVARMAIQEAAEKGYDCVLIDTAGRMQNNEPLMRALSKLISDNSPDLCLFVGEALVGNDGIDQLGMFNQALANYSPPGTRHQIDGIVLTKFDTIDTKVGAALSMTFKTGQPIIFVGTGQKYTHLRKLNVNFVTKALFDS